MTAPGVNYCANCGSPVRGGTSFCESCGASLSAGSASVQTAPGDPPPYPAPASMPPPGSYPPPPYPPGYGTHGYGPAPPMGPSTNGFSIAALVLGIVWVFGIGSILAVIFGFVARKQITQSGGRQSGGGMALAGIILGFVGIAGLVLWIVLLATVVNTINTCVSQPQTNSTVCGNTTFNSGSTGTLNSGSTGTPGTSANSGSTGSTLNTGGTGIVTGPAFAFF